MILAAYDFEPSFLSVHNLALWPGLVDVTRADACLDPAGSPLAITPATKATRRSDLHGGIAPDGHRDGRRPPDTSFAGRRGRRPGRRSDGRRPSSRGRGRRGSLALAGRSLSSAGRARGHPDRPHPEFSRGPLGRRPAASSRGRPERTASGRAGAAPRKLADRTTLREALGSANSSTDLRHPRLAPFGLARRAHQPISNSGSLTRWLSACRGTVRQGPAGRGRRLRPRLPGPPCRAGPGLLQSRRPATHAETAGMDARRPSSSRVGTGNGRSRTGGGLDPGRRIVTPPACAISPKGSHRAPLPTALLSGLVLPAAALPALAADPPAGTWRVTFPVRPQRATTRSSLCSASPRQVGRRLPRQLPAARGPPAIDLTVKDDVVKFASSSGRTTGRSTARWPASGSRGAPGRGTC